jgi:uncharacterized protein
MRLDLESTHGASRPRAARRWVFARALLVLIASSVAMGCHRPVEPAPGKSDLAPAPVATPASAPTPASPQPSAAAPSSARRKLQMIDAAVPEVRARVTDRAELLSAAEATQLEAKLAAHERATGQQFALLTIRELEGVSVENYGFTVLNTWKLGREGYNDGLLVLIGVDDRKVDIEIGTGLEGAIPDQIAASVIRDQIAPAFRGRNYAAGLNAAFDRLISLAAPSKP